MFSRISQLFLAAAFSVPAYSVWADEPDTGNSFSGNVGVVSQYVYRGGVENDDMAVQGGVEYAHKSGVTLGYWGSTLGYDPADGAKNRGFEHDLYVAYDHDFAKDWKYHVQTTAYYYQDSGRLVSEEGERRKLTGYDVMGYVAYKDLSVGATVQLNNATYANAGDVYLSAVYHHPLKYDMTLNTSVGAYIYNDAHDDSFIQTEKDVVFNEARVGVSKAFSDTGLTASLDYVVGGQDRLGDDFDNHMVAGLNFSF